ncbi:MAG TPA: methionyl-tRNA formyltransferase, partial [Chloroflexi bacterium]|nr:methionyl-tRNA formyltransferase [Chloroflexota bacterium]
VFLEQGRPVIGANPGGLQIEIVQPAGKRPMPAEDFVRGAKGFVGSRIEAPKA